MMGLEGVEGPPKKKLKQATLNFCVSTEKARKKRKLSESSDGLATRLFRQDTGSPNTPVIAENLVVNTVKKSKNDVQAKAEEDQTCKTEPANLKPAEDTVETISLSKDQAKAVHGDKRGNSCTKYEAESTDSKVVNGQVAKNESKMKHSEKRADSKFENGICTESKLDKPTPSDRGDMSTSVFLSSEHQQTVSAPALKTQPNREGRVKPKMSSKKREGERQLEEKLWLKKEKEEQRGKEEEEKKKKKQEELRVKEEEKKRREEERKRREEAKEEERKRKEEQRKKKEEARLAKERKENLAKAAFTKFFIAEKTNKPKLPKKDEKTERPKFMPFPVKSDMRLAVQVRRTLVEEEKNVLSKILSSCKPTGVTYLEELKSGRKPMASPATWPLSDEEHDDIILGFIVNGEAESSYKSKGQKDKLLQFHENRRPPYWGTWRKSSKAVGPRRPFGQDKILDYEVDSDCEWEDEGEGEDIDKGDGDSDVEEADDENVGEDGYVLDSTFVRHGYLSDEEAAGAEDDDSVEDQKLKLTALRQEFEQELKSKTKKLRPRQLGCVYIPNATLDASQSMYEPLMELRCKWDNNPIDVTSPAVVECSSSPSILNIKFPSSMVEKLAKLIHGNHSSMKALVSEFIESCDGDSSISKRAVLLKVKEIAARTYRSGSGRLAWAVNPDLCAKFGLEPVAGPSKMVPVVSPVVELEKPNDSLLAKFLKKMPQGPVKRISTTVVREGPPETPLSKGLGAGHTGTRGPMLTPQGSILAIHPDKPIRRVSTTLLSSVPGPVMNKIFNVSEIDKPGQPHQPHQPKTHTPKSIPVTP